VTRLGRGRGIPHPVDIHVGYRIRARRRFLGMSLKILANGLGVTLQQVQKYETGETRLSAARLSAIASSLGVPVSFFFANSLVDDQLAARMEQPETIELLRCYRSFANDGLRQQFLELVKAVAARRKSARVPGTSDQAIVSPAPLIAVDAGKAEPGPKETGAARMTRRRTLRSRDMKGQPMYVIRRQLGKDATWLISPNPEQWGKEDRAMRFETRGDARRTASSIGVMGDWSITAASSLQVTTAVWPEPPI
jgi:transcriptional regulator with XRE-family HTH domain